jgi:hypothetical protein
MKQKHIDASREVRLWIGDVIVPAVTLIAVVLTNENVRAKAVDMKDKVVSKFRKK